MNKKNLVFTSAGNNSAIKRWLSKGQPNFDLCIVFYGDGKCEFEFDAKYIFYRKGGKFQNLHYVFKNHADVLSQYEAIFVPDDDLKMNASDINKLFSIREDYSLYILQPSFNRMGKVSHSITVAKPFTSIRFTDFVEIACPLFEKNYLLDFLAIFDNRANCTGVDFWFCNKASQEHNKIAISDEIYCLNPHDYEKGGQREIDKFQSNEQRYKTWKMVKAENNLNFPEMVFKTFGCVYKIKLSQILLVIYQICGSLVLRMYHKLKRVLNYLL